VDEQVTARQEPITQKYTSNDGNVSFYHHNATVFFSGTELLAVRNAHFESKFVPMAERVAARAHNDLLVKAADLKVNLPVMAAEARKTSDLILGTASRVVGAYRAFRRGNLRKVADLLDISRRRSHSKWLEYKYGWMPLLMDVKGSAEFFAQQNFYGGRPAQFTVQSKGEESLYWASEDNHYTGYGGADGKYSEFFQGTYHVRRLARFEVVNQNLTVLQQLGLTNPLLVAWELVPFSFVFDWFISVGDYLTALTALQGLRCVSYMHSNWNEYDHAWVQPSTFVNDGTYVWFMSSWNRGSHTRVYARRPITMSGPDIPRLDTSKLGFQKLVTSLALLKAQNRILR
jgi:hypothetical protein